MLILTRKVGETITIGEGVLVTVLAVKGGRCVSASTPRAMWPCIAARSGIVSIRRPTTWSNEPVELL